MNPHNRQENEEKEKQGQQSSREQVVNPFENKQPAEKDVQQAQEELNKEQQFKEAMTERD